jgi:hypothetical protein
VDLFGQLAEISKLSGPALMALAIIAFVRGWVLTSGHHKGVLEQKDKQIEILERRIVDLVNEKEEFKQFAFRQTDVTDRAIQTTERVVEKVRNSRRP